MQKFLPFKSQFECKGAFNSRLADAFTDTTRPARQEDLHLIEQKALEGVFP